MKQDKQYISLKEAAQISGYAPDYIGQLIRKGKLFGKQVFSNVAWVTTEEEIRRYVDRNKEKKVAKKGYFSNHKNKLTSEKSLSVIQVIVLQLTVVVLAIFAIFLFYILVIGIESGIEQHALEKIKNATPTQNK